MIKENNMKKIQKNNSIKNTQTEIPVVAKKSVRAKRAVAAVATVKLAKAPVKTISRSIAISKRAHNMPSASRIMDIENQDRLKKLFDNNKATNKTVIKKVIASKSKEVKGKKFRLPITRKALLISGVVVIVFVLIGLSAYFRYKFRASSISANGSTQVQSETGAYIAKISKFMLLPVGENPTIATVTDKDKISGQPFFANAQNGDKVFLYTQAQKAILYRPAENKVIEVMSVSGVSEIGSVQGGQNSPQQNDAQVTPESSPQPVAQDQSQTESAKSATQSTEIARVAIYNGTNIRGLAQSIETDISAINGIKVINKTNATGSFAKTVVIDLSGKNADAVAKIAETLGGEIGQVPDGEKIPDADVLVIGGQDLKK